MKEAINTLVMRLEGLAPRIAIVLGSGLGAMVESLENAVVIPFSDLPGFPQSGVTGHEGRIHAGRLSGVPVIILSGRVHFYEHGNAGVMRPVLETLQGIGVENLLLSNAAGSLREDLPPGSVMMITDHINFSGTNPLIGEASEGRFVGMTSAYDRTICDGLRRAAKSRNIELGEGVYMWFSGPSFETPAEIRMARMMGADVVGMSTVPEVIIARFLGMNVGACSVITNFAAGMTGAELSHGETKDMAPIGGAKLVQLFSHMIADIS